MLSYAQGWGSIDFKEFVFKETKRNKSILSYEWVMNKDRTIVLLIVKMVKVNQKIPSPFKKYTEKPESVDKEHRGKDGFFCSRIHTDLADPKTRSKKDKIGRMIVQTAQAEDYTAWLRLAREVEDLFGPMVGEEAFQQTLLKNLRRGTALCVRDQDGAVGADLLGGLFYSPNPPIYTISWLAVTQKYRQQRIGLKLVEAFLERVLPPAELVVTTFSADMEGGEAARRFYLKLGFQEAETVYHDYRGKMEAYQVFRRAYGEAGQGTA